MKLLVRTSGIAYLIIFITGFYANFSILETLVDFNDAFGTTANIIENSKQFKNGLLAFLVMLIADIFLIWSLFKITEPTNKMLSYTTSFFRGLHALFFVIALVKLFSIYQLSTDATNTIELQTNVMTLLTDFDKLWTIGLLFFGVHLVLLGFVGLKVSFIPKLISFLLILAAFGYFIDGFSKLFFEGYDNYKFYFEAIVIFTGVIGEFSFTIWLLIKGFSRKIIVA